MTSKRFHRVHPRSPPRGDEPAECAHGAREDSREYHDLGALETTKHCQSLLMLFEPVMAILRNAPLIYRESSPPTVLGRLPLVPWDQERLFTIA